MIQAKTRCVFAHFKGSTHTLNHISFLCDSSKTMSPHARFLVEVLLRIYIFRVFSSFYTSLVVRGCFLNWLWSCFPVRLHKWYIPKCLACIFNASLWSILPACSALLSTHFETLQFIDLLRVEYNSLRFSQFYRENQTPRPLNKWCWRA